MELSSLDVAVVTAYIVLIFSIALSANVYMKRHFLLHRKDGLRPIENHYLAGRSISSWEAVLSIMATEFSAMGFLIIPTYVYLDNLSYIKFVIGAVLSRSFISWYFIPKIYGKGLTIFEGWPAIQFSGWPSVAVGTFGGVVSLVDQTATPEGLFRVIVLPEKGEKWPESRFIRQGTRVNSWILLNKVSLGYELWRQFNGFPPSLDAAPGTLETSTHEIPE